jgi:CheY-like chemotaxis protein
MPKKRVLVVEDNLDTYELVRLILEKYGYETFLAANGRDGVDAALKQKPDLIIMDMAMPEMDGWTATEKIKTDPSMKSIPLVALTARVTAPERARALEAGCDEFLTKPIDLNELVDTVNRWANKQ